MSDTSRTLLNELESARHTITELQEQIAKQESEQPYCAEPRDGLDEIRRQIEQAHQEGMSALDAIDDPVFLHDSEFRILRANRAYQKLAGISFKDLIGRPYFEIFPKSSGPLQGCLHALERGQDGEEETITFGGNFYRSRAFPVHNEQGRYLFSVHTLEDVTERLQMENRLLESRELLLAFIKDSPIYAFLKEVSPAESKVLAASENYVNMIGIAAKEMIGKTMPELFPADFAEKITADDWSTVASGKVLLWMKN